jgi:hypothetical protein
MTPRPSPGQGTDPENATVARAPRWLVPSSAVPKDSTPARGPRQGWRGNPLAQPLSAREQLPLNCLTAAPFFATLFLVLETFRPRWALWRAFRHVAQLSLSKSAALFALGRSDLSCAVSTLSASRVATAQSKSSYEAVRRLRIDSASLDRSVVTLERHSSTLN